MHKTSFLNTNADVSSETGGLNFGLSLPLRLYFMYARGVGPGETGRIQRGSSISGKGSHVYKKSGVRVADFISFFLIIPYPMKRK